MGASFDELPETVQRVTADGRTLDVPNVERYAAEVEDSTPGKFEGEGPATAYYYGFGGDGETLESDDCGGGGCELFDTTEEERLAFQVEAPHFLLSWDSQGFISGEFLSSDEVKELRASIETAERVARADTLEERLSVTVWQERDRLHVALVEGSDAFHGEDVTVVEWWDEDAVAAFEDGFLDAGDAVLGRFSGRRFPKLLASAKRYARDMGLLDAARARILAGEV